MGKKSKLNTSIRDYTRIVGTLYELDKGIIIDFFTSIYDDGSMADDFSAILDLSSLTKSNYTEYLSIIIKTVENHERGFKNILDIAIRRVSNYLKERGYLDLPFNDLITEINLDTIPSIHGTGVSPEMMLLYYIGRGVYSGPEYDSIKELYYEHLERTLALSEIDQYLKMPGDLEGSNLEAEFNGYVEEADIRNLDESIFDAIAEAWKIFYDPSGKAYTIPRGMLLFFYQKFADAVEHDKHVQGHQKLLNRAAARFSRFIIAIKSLIADRAALREQINRLRSKNKEQSKEIQALSEQDKQSGDPGLEIAKLKKELFAAQRLNEKLEARISVLEEEERINKEIKKDLKVETEPTEPETENLLDPGDFFTVAISGGFWESGNIGEVESIFPFIKWVYVPANQTIRKSDTIQNADLVIFDTSRHAHTYYRRIKEKAAAFRHINKSKPGEIKALFAV